MRSILFVLFLFSVIFLSCGNPKGGYAYHAPHETTPITIAVGDAARFNLLDIGFYISHYAENASILNINNYSQLPAMIKVSDSSGAVVFQSDSLAVSNYIEKIEQFQAGASYRFEGWIWQLNKNPTNCPKMDEECFYEGATQIVNF